LIQSSALQGKFKVSNCKTYQKVFETTAMKEILQRGGKA